MPWTIIVKEGTGFEVFYTVPAGPFLAITFMEWNTSGGEPDTSNVAVDDIGVGVRIWERFAGASSDEITWDGLYCMPPGHQLQVTSSTFAQARFFASGYFYSAPSTINYEQSH